MNYCLKYGGAVMAWAEIPIRVTASVVSRDDHEGLLARVRALEVQMARLRELTRTLYEVGARDTAASRVGP